MVTSIIILAIVAVAYYFLGKNGRFKGIKLVSSEDLKGVKDFFVGLWFIIKILISLYIWINILILIINDRSDSFNCFIAYLFFGNVWYTKTCIFDAWERLKQR